MTIFVVIIGLTALGAGVVMALFAWNVIHQHRGREAARVELLARLAVPEGIPVMADLGIDEFLSEHAVPAGAPLFREPEKSDVGSRRTIALAAVCVVMTLVVSTYVAFASHRPAPESSRAAPAPSAATVSAPKPDPQVELLALDHAATSAGLVVTGRLRNPAGGPSLHDVVAVVDVMDRSGHVITTASAPIARPMLNAGEWSDFSVAASKTADVARYRVEFHAKEREPLPQIDRRPPVSTSRSE